MQYELIIPVASKDIDVLIYTMNYIIKYIPAQRYIVISSSQGLKSFETIKKQYPEIEFMDEDKIIAGLTIDALKEYMMTRGYNLSKLGWYYQQFIKMAYCKIATTEYYMTWDADTVPVKPVHMFDEDIVPFFDLKKEYEIEYFKTNEKMLSLGKYTDKDDSFISEHMIFSKKYMKELIAKIENSSDEAWYFNIFHFIDYHVLRDGKSGFSEFETYGNYIMKYYPTSYRMRKVRALRAGGRVFKLPLSEEEIDWLGESFFSVSFEGGIKKGQKVPMLYKNKQVRAVMDARKYERLIALYYRIKNLKIFAVQACKLRGKK